MTDKATKTMLASRLNLLARSSYSSSPEGSALGQNKLDMVIPKWFLYSMQLSDMP